jgi:hypothetical protein
MNETSFIKSIHNSIDKKSVHVWKIHDTFTGGVPDAMYSGKAGVLFVEYKYIKTLPKKDNTVIRHSLSPQQVIWLDRMRQSAHAALIIGAESNSGVIIVDDFSTNISKMSYLEQSITTKELAQWISTTVVQGRTHEKIYRTASSSTQSSKTMAK